MKNVKLRSPVVAITALAALSFTLLAQETVDTDNRSYNNKNDEVTEDKSEHNRRADLDNQAQRHSMSEKHISATKLISKKVVNDQGERLGKIDDLIVSDGFTVKYAVLSVGGAMGVGSQKIAVPLSDLNCSGENIRLSATKEGLKNSAKTPSGEWAVVSGEVWTRNVNGFYGQPIAVIRDDRRSYRSDLDNRRFDRDPVLSGSEDRENVRVKQGAGARDLIDHPTNADLFKDPSFGDKSDRVYSESDRALSQTINDRIRQDYDPTISKSVSVRVENGVATVRGTVATKAEKQSIESRIKEINGVTRVNNQLSVRD